MDPLSLLSLILKFIFYTVIGLAVFSPISTLWLHWRVRKLEEELKNRRGY